MVGVAQRPRLIRVKMRVTSDSRPGEVGVCKEAALSVKGRAIAMET